MQGQQVPGALHWQKMGLAGSILSPKCVEWNAKHYYTNTNADSMGYIHKDTTSSGGSWVRVCIMVVQSDSWSLKLVPIGKIHMRITYVTLSLSFTVYPFRDIHDYLLSKICIFAVFIHHTLILSNRKGVSLRSRVPYERWYIKKLESISCAMMNIAKAYGH